MRRMIAALMKTKQLLSFLFTLPKISSIILLVTILHFLWHATAIAAPPGNSRVVVKPPLTMTFAYFPLAVPVAVLGETLKRDRIMQKALARSGVTIKFRTFAKGNDALAMISQNKIDGIMLSDMPAIEAAITGEMLIVGIVKRSYAAVVAPQGTMIEQLRHKKIGNAFGSTSHYALMQALSSVGLSEKDVSIVPLEVNQMPEALASGKIFAFAAWEPTPTAVLNKYPGQFTNIHRQVSTSYFLISRQLVSEKPAAADALAAALVRSIRWMKKGNNLAKASRWALTGMRDFTGKEPSLTVADIARITYDDLLDIPAAPLITTAKKDAASILGKEFDFLKKIGKIPAEASQEKFRSAIKPDLLQRVLAEADRHKLNTFDYAP